MRKLTDYDMNKLVSGMVASALLALGCGAEDPASAPANHENPSSVEPELAPIADRLPPGYVQTPNGQVHESCVHEVPDDGELDVNGAVWVRGQLVRAAPPPCAYEVLHLNRANPASATYGDVARLSRALPIEGWAAYVEASANNLGVSPPRFNGIETTMTVPEVPVVALFQQIFLFPSLTPADGRAILQPVLSWGGEAGARWAVAGWYVDRNRNEHHSPWALVSPGEQIVGWVRDVRNSCVGTTCTWDVKLRRGTTTIASLRVDSTEAYTRAQKGALEAYGITNCRMLPSSGRGFFMTTKVYEPYDPFNVDARIEMAGSLNWKRVLVDTSCGIDALSPNPQTAVIIWTPR